VLELRLLGIPKLRWGDAELALPSPKILAILAYLAARAEPCSRRELLELFWEEGKPSNLRFALFKLRELEGAESWLSTDDKMALVTAQTDLAALDSALRAGRFEEALAIWQADSEGERVLLHGFELTDAPHFMNWLELERVRLGQHYLDTLQQMIAVHESRQRFAEAIALARRLLAQDRLNETAHRTIMRLEHKQGNTEAALLQFERCRLILQQELGVEPLPDTLELLKEIEGADISGGRRAALLKAPDDLPARAPQLFGRQQLIDETLAQLRAHNRVLLQGFGGAGKTALAAAVAESHLAGGTPVLWVQAGDDAPELLLERIARAFAVPQLQQVKAHERPGLIRTLLAKQPLSLIVLDDVWNAYALSKLIELLPNEQALLVTSRQRYPKLTRLEVGRLARGDALQLLSFHAGQPLEPQAAGSLCDLLGDHAFAVRIAGINLSVDTLSPEALLSRIQDAPHTMTIPAEFVEAGKESVSALLTASLQTVTDAAHEAYMAFGILLSSSATPELLARCTRRSELETEVALIELQRRGLAERVSTPGSDIVSYRLHDLAYSFARANNHFRNTTVLRACHEFLAQHLHNFDLLDADLENLLGAAEYCKRNKQDSDLLVMMKYLVVGDAYYTARGHSSRSLTLLESAVDTARQLADWELAHHLVTKLGNAYRELIGDLDKTLQAYQAAYDYAVQCNNTHRQAISLSLIGITRFQQGHDDADNFLERAYRLAEVSQDDLARLHVLQNQGTVLGFRSDWTGAERLLAAAVEIAERLLKACQGDPAEVTFKLFFSLLNLGEATRKLGAFKPALQLRERALALATVQNNQLWMAYSHHEMGEMFHDIDERQQAERHYQLALDLYEQNHAYADLEQLRHFLEAEGYSSGAKSDSTLNTI
jgi:DNA-binding SARP family transcriptional activator